jgi:hypothetical protein
MPAAATTTPPSAAFQHTTDVGRVTLKRRVGLVSGVGFIVGSIIGDDFHMVTAYMSTTYCARLVTNTVKAPNFGPH